MQRFREDEAQEILRRAATPTDEITREELERAAAEMGITPDALARAEAEIREERLRKEFDAKVRANTMREVVKFAGVMALLIFINLTSSPQHLWFFYPLFGWGLSMVGSFGWHRNRHSPSYQRAFARWREKQGALSEGLRQPGFR